MRILGPPRRRLVRILLATATVLALVIGLPALWMAVFTPPAGVVRLPTADPSPRLKVYVMAWGYHSSIFVEQAPEWRLGPEGNDAAHFVEYGWGDRSFFMESNYCPDSLLCAAFLPTPTVVYVRGHDRPPDEFVVGGVIAVRECSESEVLKLVDVLERQFVRTAEGARAQPYPQVPRYDGRFYPGRESYVIWWNCNEWTVRMLRDADLASSAAFVGMTNQVMGRLVGFELARRSGSDQNRER